MLLVDSRQDATVDGDTRSQTKSPQKGQMRRAHSRIAGAIVVSLMLVTGRLGAEEKTPAADEASSSLPSQQVPADVVGPVQPTPGDNGPNAGKKRELAHSRFLDLLDDELYEEALIAARQVVDLTAQEFGPDGEPMIVPLTNLATTQVEIGDLTAAEENYKIAIALVEKYHGLLSPRLINPLIGLGGVYNRLERYAPAVDTFSRALRVNHVEKGFTNPDQFPIRDGMTESYIGLDETDEANFHQETQLEINRRRFGSQSAETAGAYSKLGDWYTRSGQVEPALESYARADRIYRNEGSVVLHQRIASLEALAQLYQRLGQLGPSSSVLRRALEIVNAEAELDLPLRARVLVDLGDLYTIFNKLDSAASRYLGAWDDLSSDDDYLDARDEYFDQPVRVAGMRLANLSSTAEAREAPRGQLRDGYVLLSYTVTPRGRVADIKIIESDPPDVMDERLVSLWQRSKFRPRYVDGQAVAAENLLLRHDFTWAEAPPKRETEAGKPDNKGALEYPGKKEE